MAKTSCLCLWFYIKPCTNFQPFCLPPLYRPFILFVDNKFKLFMSNFLNLASFYRKTYRNKQYLYEIIKAPLNSVPPIGSHCHVTIMASKEFEITYTELVLQLVLSYVGINPPFWIIKISKLFRAENRKVICV